MFNNQLYFKLNICKTYWEVYPQQAKGRSISTVALSGEQWDPEHSASSGFDLPQTVPKSLNITLKVG
jgi:hypothetical protein